MSAVQAIEPGAPPQVREGDPAARRAYATALQFEQMLVGELSQSLVQGSGLEAEASGAGRGGEAGGEGADPGAALSSLLPQALGESIMRGGGLGLAAGLTRALDPALGASTQAATDGSGGAPAARSQGGVAA